MSKFHSFASASDSARLTQRPGMDAVRLFGTAFLQVFFVSANTLFISRMYWPGVVVAGWMISFLWTLNVSGIKKDTWALRISYSTGAMLGGIAGVLIANMIEK